MTTEPNADVSWAQYKLLLLAQIADLQREMEQGRDAMTELRTKELADLRTEVALLKLKNSLWSILLGSLSGGLITIGTLLMHGR